MRDQPVRTPRRLAARAGDWVGLALALTAGLGTPAGAAAPEGFAPESAAAQAAYERDLSAELSAERIGEVLGELASRPHRAGSEGARLTAAYLHQQLESYGFRTETVRYEGYLPAPVSAELELLEPRRLALAVTEPPVAGDPYTGAAAEHPGWNGYSPSGEAEAQVVYGNYGSWDDLRRLEEMGVGLRGKILLLRNFGAGAGRKVRNAEHFGAAGVVLYTDPAEDGYPYGDVYPRGNWRPGGSIMRRTVIFLPYEGDPLSPGWASLPGAPRLRPDEVALPRIPVLPVSYDTARILLEALGGPVAPGDWQGALPVTYRVGPGPATLRLRVVADNRDRPMLDVVGRLEGETAPEQWVIVSNHHDAWIWGAGDPSSGTAALLELARGVGELARRGRRPRRTLIVAFWDAEEMMLGGSTEWVEEHAGELLDKAVACVNMDSAVFNPERPLSVAAHPLLHRLFREVAHEVEDPRTGRSTYEVWRELQNRYRATPGVDGWGEFFDPGPELARPWVFEIPYDDAAPFFNYLALPASDMYYGADYGMYHSLYENLHWMKTVADPGFRYHRVMARLQGLAALRLANADLLPFDFAEEARYWRLAYRDLERVAGERGQRVPELAEALGWIDRWQETAVAVEREGAALLAAGVSLESRPRELIELNRRLLQAPRDLLRLAGRPEAPTERNLFAGSSLELEPVSGSTLPGLRFALDRGEAATAAAEADTYLAALRRRVETLGSILVELRELRGPASGEAPPD